MSQELKIPKSTGTFPCMVVFVGSAVGMVKIDEKNNMRRCGGSTWGGKTFLALGRLLAGTSDYNELIALAEQGDIRNTDTQVKEIFSNNGDSPYGQFEPDIPLLPFGKAVDHEKNLEDFCKEDLIASLVNMLTSITLAQIISTGFNHGITNYVRNIMFQRPVPHVMIFRVESFLA